MNLHSMASTAFHHRRPELSATDKVPGTHRMVQRDQVDGRRCWFGHCGPLLWVGGCRRHVGHGAGLGGSVPLAVIWHTHLVGAEVSRVPGDHCATLCIGRGPDDCVRELDVSLWLAT